MPQPHSLADSTAAPPDVARLPLLFAPRLVTGAWSDGGSGSASVHVTGELDLATLPQLEQTLHEAQVDARLVVLDLRDLAFMDCAGMRAIVDADKRARRDGRQLIVLRGPAQVDKVFALTGVSDVIEISDHDPREPPTDRTLPLVAVVDAAAIC